MSPGSSRIDLLGPPRLTRAGQQVTVRGRKTWALLTVLVGTRSPMERRRLAAMLFDQAEDPLGSLRWHLSQVRRALGVDGVIEGDPVTLRLAPWVVVDLHVLEHGGWRDAVALPGVGAELLAAHVGGAPVFDAWLAAERARVCSLTAGHFTEAAMTLLTTDDPAGAARIAARLIELQPLDENHHHLLVRSLVMAGRPAAARRHVRAATVLLTRELGVPPSPNLAACAEAVESGGVGSPSAAGVRAQLDAGHAAIDAGATAAGLDCLRRAAREAQVLTDPELAVRTLTGLGAALVHAVRGRDTEGAVSLHEAIRVAHDAGRAQSAAAAHRELGWISVQHGRGRQAMAWLDRAHELAGPDVGEQARVLGVRGLALDDGGRHQAAMAAFARSAELARDSGQPRQRAWSLSMWARTYLEFGDHAAAAPLVAEAVTITRREAWNAFLPYPETQHGLLALERGDRNEAADLLQHAYALACHLADPCWEALAQHGLALVELGDGDVRAAVVRLHDARQRCRRHPDTYRWVTAHILDALCGIGVAHRLPDAATWVRELEALALGAGLRDQIVRAHRHRAGLGEPAAAASAELLARETDNPALLS